MNWERDLPTWTRPETSRRVSVGGVRWHVQEAGVGPTLLLLHGAGGSVHSWAALIPGLAETFHVVAVDLPGQGFSRAPAGRRAGLAGMSGDLRALLQAEGWMPQAILAHSAGAALGLRICADLGIARLVGINPALAPFEGVAGWLFPVLAKMLALNPFTVPLFTLGSSGARARRLIEGTGSRIGAEGLDYYARLLGDNDHVRGTLAMMAHWDLGPLLADLPALEVEALFLLGENDRAVPPATGARAAARMAHAEVRRLPGLGHLAHEEDPARVLDEVLGFLAR